MNVDAARLVGIESRAVYCYIVALSNTFVLYDMSRTTETFSISVPPEMAAELERVRKIEHRTRSELVREALRQYIRGASARSVKARAAALPEARVEADEVEAIEAGRRQFRSGKTVTLRHALDRRAQPPRRKKP